MSAINQQIAVVIVNFNAGPRLMESVWSVLDSHTPVELLVCDNGSGDGSFTQLRSELQHGGWQPGPHGGLIQNGREGCIHLIANGQNLGFAAANNIALELTGADYILLLNPDCILHPDTLSRVLEELDKNPDAGMAGCRIMNGDGSEQQGSRRRLPTLRSGLLKSLRNRLFSSGAGIDQDQEMLPPGVVNVEAISGAFMLLRREAVEQVGLMDESYFLHCEDLDYCKRFQDQGWKIMFVPDVEVTHIQGTCSRSRPVRVEWHKHRGMIRYYDKFLAQDSPFYLNWLVKVGVATRFLLLALIVSIPGRHR